MDKFIKKHIDKWDWEELSGNTSITPEFIEKHPEYPWDWGEVSLNDSITMDFIEKHIDKWNWKSLSYK